MHIVSTQSTGVSPCTYSAFNSEWVLPLGTQLLQKTPPSSLSSDTVHPLFSSSFKYFKLFAVGAQPEAYCVNRIFSVGSPWGYLWSPRCTTDP